MDKFYLIVSVKLLCNKYVFILKRFFIGLKTGELCNKNYLYFKGAFREIYFFCVTVDNFNEFSAKAEKLSFINIHSGTITISIDDLRVYSDYFDSSLYFLHYLKQRKLAIQIKNLNLNDELAYLGMYIKHNLYLIIMKEFDNNSFVNFNGYRE